MTSVHKRYDTRIFLKECASLASYGYITSLIVADGKGDEKTNGVTIFDVGAPVNRLDRIYNAPSRVFNKAIDLDADIYHLHDPELIPIGLKLKKANKKVIFDIHENTDLQILIKEWIPLHLRKATSLLYSKYESHACKKFDILIVPQISMQKKFSQYSKAELIANFPSENIQFSERNNLNKFKLLYSGLLDEARGLFNMLNLISMLAEKDQRYQLTLAGPISDIDLNKAKNHSGWNNTKYLGILSKDEIYDQYQNNSIGLILFNNVGQYYMSYALKLFEYMQCGMTVIMPDFGDWLDFNEEFEAGFNVNTSNVNQATNVIHKLDTKVLEKYSNYNMQLAATEFTWATQEKKLINLYEVLLSENGL